MECSWGCMTGCMAVRSHRFQMAADKRQELPDNRAEASWESPKEFLAYQLMIYSSYHLFFTRYHQCMPR